MVSSYLQRPIRTFEQALEDRARVRGETLGLGPGTQAGPTVDRYEPIDVRIRLLANDHGTAADDPTPPGGRRATSPAKRLTRIPAKRRSKEQPKIRRERSGRQAKEVRPKRIRRERA